MISLQPALADSQQLLKIQLKSQHNLYSRIAYAVKEVMEVIGNLIDEESRMLDLTDGVKKGTTLS